jgi:hypothetical protein
MISNHAQFLQAVQDRKKVWIKFYSKPDSGVLEGIYAPLAYGPGGGYADGMNRYWIWDYGSATPRHTLGLLSQEIVELTLFGETFDPALLVETPPPQAPPSAPPVVGA